MSRMQDLPTSSTSEHRFTFRWTIENISFCTLQENKSLKSEKFFTKELQDTEWFLELYPRGFGDKNIITCFLNRTDKGPENVRVEFSMTFGGSFFLYSHTFEKNSRQTPGGLNRERLIYQIEHKFAKDVLFVECNVWQTIPVASSSAPEDNQSTPEANKLLANKSPIILSAYTRIPVEKWNIECSIDDFNTRSTLVNANFPVNCMLDSAPELVLTFHKSSNVSDAKDMIEIRRKTWLEETEAICAPFYLKCNLKIKDSQMEYYDITWASHFFKPSEPAMFIMYNFNELVFQNRDNFIPLGTLTFKCELSVSYRAETSGYEYVNFDYPKIVDKQSYERVRDFRDTFEYKYNENKFLFRFLVIVVICLALVPHFLWK